jgi:hypothetical protein
VSVIFLTFLTYCYGKTPHRTQHWITKNTKSTTQSHYLHLPLSERNFNSLIITFVLITQNWMCERKTRIVNIFVRTDLTSNNAICILLSMYSKCQPVDGPIGSKHVSVWTFLKRCFDGYLLTYSFLYQHFTYVMHSITLHKAPGMYTHWEKRLLASSFLSVHPSAWSNSASIGQIFMKFDIWAFF